MYLSACIVYKNGRAFSVGKNLGRKPEKRPNFKEISSLTFSKIFAKNQLKLYNQVNCWQIAGKFFKIQKAHFREPL